MNEYVYKQINEYKFNDQFTFDICKVVNDTRLTSMTRLYLITVKYMLEGENAGNISQQKIAIHLQYTKGTIGKLESYMCQEKIMHREGRCIILDYFK